MEYINYPKGSKGDNSRFVLGWKLPIFRRIQSEFGLQVSSSYPEVNWKEERFLAGIIIGADDACARLNEIRSYCFDNISLPKEALALIGMLSIYLNALQTLQEQR